jgi:hypothetical protein
LPDIKFFMLCNAHFIILSILCTFFDTADINKSVTRSKSHFIEIYFPVLSLQLFILFLSLNREWIESHVAPLQFETLDIPGYHRLI